MYFELHYRLIGTVRQDLTTICPRMLAHGCANMKCPHATSFDTRPTSTFTLPSFAYLAFLFASAQNCWTSRVPKYSAAQLSHAVAKLVVLTLAPSASVAESAFRSCKRHLPASVLRAATVEVEHVSTLSCSFSYENRQEHLHSKHVKFDIFWQQVRYIKCLTHCTHTQTHIPLASLHHTHTHQRGEQRGGAHWALLQGAKHRVHSLQNLNQNVFYCIV